jgi:hypothetical protein
MRLSHVSFSSSMYRTDNVREHVMNNVVLNDAMEDVAANEAKFTIDGRSGTLDESPVVGLVVRSILVGVVKVSDRNYNK